MRWRWRPRSLQLYLALWLSLLYVAAIAAVVIIFVHRTRATEQSLREHELVSRADDLARAVKLDVNGLPVLRMPRDLARQYAQSDENVFAIRTLAGNTIDASPKSFGILASRLPPPTDDDDDSYFHLDDIGTRARNYYGMAIASDSAAGTLIVYVARAEGAETLADTVLQDFAVDMAWMMPLIVLLTLGIGVFAIRRGLAPVQQVSTIAANITPQNTSIRLPEDNVPNEVRPLVVAMNSALDRLEGGFATQREFTANAAHELRTPLAIVTGALESMESSEDIVKLRADVARMNRLVEQLLSVARLDSVALDVSHRVDLNRIASEVVASMAPWAIAQDRNLALIASAEPAFVQGNEYAIADAVRNLVENAVTQSPPSTEVRVEVEASGMISVIDQGPGIPFADRERVFARFWRGKVSSPSRGAGLGLAIIQEIMRAHAGQVTIADNPGGGAVFSLVFQHK